MVDVDALSEELLVAVLQLRYHKSIWQTTRPETRPSRPQFVTTKSLIIKC